MVPEATSLAENCLKQMMAITRLKPAGTISFRPTEIGWTVEVEMLEKESIPSSMDILGLYEVQLDKEGKILNFSRKAMRKRSDTA